MNYFPYNDLNDALENVYDALHKGAYKKGSDFTLCCFATSLNNSPQTRMVVLREFDKENRNLIIFSDKRTQKVRAVQANPTVEILFWSKRSSLQVRITGMCKIVSYHDYVCELDKGKPFVIDSNDYKSILSPGEFIKTSDVEFGHDATENFVAIKCVIQKLEWLWLDSSQNRLALYEWNDSGQCEMHYCVP